jgi:predicted deacylase
MQIIRHPLLSPAPGTQRELVSLHYGQPGGQKAYIQASLHADELPGMLVAHHLRHQLNELDAAGQINGEIILVPMANPIGLSQFVMHGHQGRFELTTGSPTWRRPSSPTWGWTPPPTSPCCAAR